MFRNPSDFESRPRSFLEQVLFVLLLMVGLYFPTSTNGEHSTLCIITAFVVLIGLLGLLIWRVGPRPGAGTFIALPLFIILVVCTIRALLGIAPQVDLGICVKFAGLALLLTLNLRRISVGRLVETAFTVANVLNLAFGVAILIGSEWVAEFLPRFYWSFYPELMPNMVKLHKPVLTLGTHASASFFLYVFFWVNWERYTGHSSKKALLFALSYIALLFGLTSFSSLGFGFLALMQTGIWLWKRNRKAAIAAVLCSAIAVSLLFRVAAQYVDMWELTQLEFGSTFLNLDKNGPLARYGRAGGSMPAVEYLFAYPLSPIGLTTPPSLAGGSAALGDSGPIEYLLRGSVPLLVLMYVGLYRFLRFNLASPSHALLLLVVIVGFETAFSLLVYIRTLYLLPFVIVYLNNIAKTGDRDCELTPGCLLATCP
jgi:hypothetical protein